MVRYRSMSERGCISTAISDSLAMPKYSSTRPHTSVPMYGAKCSRSNEEEEEEEEEEAADGTLCAIGAEEEDDDELDDEDGLLASANRGFVGATRADEDEEEEVEE